LGECKETHEFGLDFIKIGVNISAENVILFLLYRFVESVKDVASLWELEIFLWDLGGIKIEFGIMLVFETEGLSVLCVLEIEDVALERWVQEDNKGDYEQKATAPGI